MRQDEAEFAEQNLEDARLHAKSYRQTLCLTPVVQHSLLLETSARPLRADSTCILQFENLLFEKALENLSCQPWCKSNMFELFECVLFEMI